MYCSKVFCFVFSFCFLDFLHLFEMFLENQKVFPNEQGHANQFSLVVAIILLMNFLSINTCYVFCFAVTQKM